MEKATRAYIQEHQSEFVPEGVDTAQVLAEITAEAAAVASEDVAEQDRQKERDQRGFLLKMIHDGWEHSTSTTILYFVIAVLVLTNLWTYMHMRPVDKSRLKAQEIAKDKLAGVVTALWDDIAAGKLAVGAVTGPAAAEPVPSPAAPETLKLELGSLKTTLHSVEERVRIIEERLEELQPRIMDQMD